MQENLIAAWANAANSNSIPPDPLADAEGWLPLLLALKASPLTLILGMAPPNMMGWIRP